MLLLVLFRALPAQPCDQLVHLWRAKNGRAVETTVVTVKKRWFRLCVAQALRLPKKKTYDSRPSKFVISETQHYWSSCPFHVSGSEWSSDQSQSKEARSVADPCRPVIAERGHLACAKTPRNILSDGLTLRRRIQLSSTRKRIQPERKHESNF